MIQIIDAVLKINPDAKVVIRGTDINTCIFEWYEETPPISRADIEAKIPEVEFDTAMEDLRSKRNQLLQDTDFHALSDNTMSTDMTTYRQELRDLTNGITTVEQANAVVFPTKP